MTTPAPIELRLLGTSDLRVSPVAMGHWPIAGMTSLRVTESAGRATLHAALDAGAAFFDTAYCYGAEGESERLTAGALGGVRGQIVIAAKGGRHGDARGGRVLGARPAALRRECEESLRGWTPITWTCCLSTPRTRIPRRPIPPARRWRMSTLGVLHYLAPSIPFVLAVLVFQESFRQTQLASFACIWTAVAVYTADSLWSYRLRRAHLRTALIPAAEPRAKRRYVGLAPGIRKR